VPKHIGIVAVSAEGAALCYRTVCVEGASMLGPHAHPEITMHTYPLSAYMRHIDAGRWEEVGSMLLASAEKLRQAGAELLICPDNTAHQAIDLIRDRSPVPWLHIAEEVASVAAERGFRRLLILGTKYLMEGPVYPAKLRSTAIECEIPSADERNWTRSTSWLTIHRPRPPSLTRSGRIRPANGSNTCPRSSTACDESTAASSCPWTRLQRRRWQG
jgi:aspartate racemase